MRTLALVCRRSDGEWHARFVRLDRGRLYRCHDEWGDWDYVRGAVLALLG